MAPGRQRDLRFAGGFALLNLPPLLGHSALAHPLHLEWLSSDKALFFALWIAANLALGWRWRRGPADRPRRDPRGRLLLAAAGLALGALVLLAAEGLLRVSGLYLTYSERNFGRYDSVWGYRNEIPWLRLAGEPNTVRRQTVPEYSVEERLNSEGVRDVDHRVAKPPGTYRVLLVGSSFTAGVGVEFSDSYSQVLARLLAPRGVEVIVAGVAGSDPVFFHQLIARRLLKYEPDLVVVTVNDADVFDVLVHGGMDRFDEDGFVVPPPAPLLEPIYRRSHLVRAFLEEVLDFNFLLLSQAERDRRYDQTVPVIAEALDAIRALGEAEGFELLVVNNPSLRKLHKKTSDDTDLAALPGLLAERGIRYLDLREHFQAAIPRGEEADYYWPIDRHYKAPGYAIMAETVADALPTIPGFPGGRASDGPQAPR